MERAVGQAGASRVEAVLPGFVDDLVAGRRLVCQATVQALLDGGAAPRELYQGLFQPALYEVGERWQRGEATVAAEHLATAIVEELLALVFPHALAQHPTGRRALVSCAADELHQVGGRIVADTLEAMGWSTTFIGAGEPVERLAEAVAARPHDLACLSVAIVDHLPGAERSIAALRRVAPTLPVVVGGQALRQGGAEALERHPGVRVLGSLAELEVLIEAWGR